ncbi:purine nucleoside phosphorylase [Vulcanimicrobium alpinum]|uniref:Purine nucleoside phosphorylase n=1 Tax=Vulcanimicrobium alpinum TaxID=3016050 RepID=A0AAN2CAI8_UNVUL|nr:purine-nucleoside phosphorylase [Vulcanimicrobium alpinum]BDE07710.1 purine nucleoside phosphorylase [Vulcanimicrobium alpinum]
MKRKRLDAAAGLLREKAGGDLDCAIVLGSGFGAVLRDRIDGTTIPYRKIDGMPEPTIAGHAGEAHVGRLHDKRVVAFSGRFHLYEGRDATEVIYPVVAAALAGAKTIVLTNAAGGINADYRAGDVMLLVDQLNLTGQNPLTGVELLPGAGARFVDMVDAYAPHLRELARHMAAEYGIVLHDGVYAGLTGPTYETPAEIRYLRTIGADAVGMSTVLETIAARALGRDVVGFSLITNVHGSGAPTSHDDVLEVSQRSAEGVARLVEGIVANLDPAPPAEPVEERTS